MCALPSTLKLRTIVIYAAMNSILMKVAAAPVKSIISLALYQTNFTSSSGNTQDVVHPP